MITLASGEILVLRTPYNYDTDEASIETGTICEKETLTKQEFKDEVDINTIVERFNATGEKPPVMQFPDEQEFAETFDFQTSMNVLVKANEAFMELPAKTRARFGNDPQQFMEFIHDKENAGELVKMGLATAKERTDIPKPEPKQEEKKE